MVLKLSHTRSFSLLSVFGRYAADQGWGRGGLARKDRWTEGLSSAFTGSGCSQASSGSARGRLQEPGGSRGHTVTGQQSAVRREHGEMLVREAGQ